MFLGISGNDEQERTVKLIGEHYVNNCHKQLMLYVAGTGGSGKSHVINTIVEFYNRCNCSNELLLSAPTGCTAVLISGYTIHSLTSLPKS
ncbi:hypothetical protein SERLA73DRAFT_190543, partial [Serpula lacrymans var. lacrymans S7.3]